MEIKQTGRIVILVEMSDGEIRAIDGKTSSVEIDMHRGDEFDFEMFYNPRFITPMRTTIHVDLTGPWKLYAGHYPEQPNEVKEIEERKQLDNVYDAEPGDWDFKW